MKLPKAHVAVLSKLRDEGDVGTRPCDDSTWSELLKNGHVYEMQSGKKKLHGITGAGALHVPGVEVRAAHKPKKGSAQK